ncbi:MAG: hypothetical protein AAB631_02175 [Patescibacteria group bacterium]
MKFLIFSFAALFLGTAVFLAGGILHTARAQTPPPTQFFLTWRANNFYPSFFEGKVFPTAGTPITASLEALRGGKFLDLSRVTITWFINDKLMDRGDGKKEILFTPKSIAGETVTIKATARLMDQENIREISLQVPVLSPQIVANIPLPLEIVASQSRFLLEAFPFFWNIKTLNDLYFTWTINGEQKKAQGENTLSLGVGTPASEYDRTLQINLLAQNLSNPLEFAQERFQLTIQ